uniref:60S ribosomal protein L27 n=1 Tax=Strongyloides papillosus TaxID=174720 RepID=A0A0N5C1N4_STREA
MIIVNKGKREVRKSELRNEEPYKFGKVNQFHVMYKKRNRIKFFRAHFTDVKKIPATELQKDLNKRDESRTKFKV